VSLYEKIMKLYPTLDKSDFAPFVGTILLQNDSNGKGDYIKSWTNSNSEPTEAQLASYTE